ncbi:MAG: MBL fold metallo-hydrolase [Abditibacteriota bacterium]|nr:MBL fold metallo-hydrolase [Abditibacteriota bacterium]
MNIKTIDKNQIGGAVIVIEEGGKRIMFDYGTELPGFTPKEEWDFENNPIDAVFISHIHEDHIGKIYNIPNDTPIYMGEFTYKIIIRTLKSLVGLYKYHINDQKAKEEAKKKLDYLESKYKNDKIIFQSNGHKIVVEPFTVTPYMVDHSSYDAYMFLVETYKEKLVFTGDFRNVGYDYDIFKTIEKLSKPIDYLIIEGTNIDKGGKVLPPTPSLFKMKRDLSKLFKEHRHIFLIVASTNIQAIKTFTNAAKRKNIYTYVTYKQKNILKDYWYKNEKCMEEMFGKLWQLDDNIDEKKHQSPKNQKFYSQKELMKKHGFLTIIKPGTSQINIKDFKEEKPIVIYSMWKGYLDRTNKDTCIETYADFIDECDKLGFDVYYDFHLSGHATPDAIADVINEINPQKAIYPVHTNYKEGFLALPLSEELKTKIKI